MEELKQLMVEMTKTCKTLTAFLEYQYAKDNGIKGPAPAPAPTAATTKVEKPARAKKTEQSKPAEQAPKTVEEALGTEEPAMSEKESLDTANKLAVKYLQEGDKEARKKDLIGHLERKYGKKTISALTHIERVEFVGYLKSLDAQTAETGLTL